jgi:hypothetical protein
MTSRALQEHAPRQVAILMDVFGTTSDTTPSHIEI